MMNPGVVPLAVLAEDEHFLGDMVGINHVEVDEGVLLEEAGPGCAPIVVGGDGDELLKWQEQFVDASETQHVQLKVAGLREELQLHHVVLLRESLQGTR